MLGLVPTAVGRDTLRDLERRPLRLEKEEQLDSIRRRDEDHQSTLLTTHDWLSEPFPELQPSYGEVVKKYSLQDLASRDPTTLIVIDEADRLRMASLEQVRAIFDAAEIGLILIGMPGQFSPLPLASTENVSKRNGGTSQFRIDVSDFDERRRRATVEREWEGTVLSDARG